MSEVEADEAEDDNAKHKHVLCAPAVAFSLGGHSITIDTAPAL